ncbi:MAG: DMT family transporter [Ottowia sp.]|uniref:DMT family transporter n=1 Tax=Ottowia sp. TaxID=1898956 RepID=UPI0039E57249
MNTERRPRWLGIGCGLAAALIWGGFPVMTRFGVAHSSLDMYDVTFLRFAVSGALLWPVVLRAGFAGLGPLAVVLMVAGIGAPYMLVVSHGLARAPVGLFAIVTPGTMIACSVLLSACCLKTRLSKRGWAAVGAILAGIALAGYPELRGAAGSGAAIGLFVFGGVLWAVYTVSTKVFAVGALHATAVVSVVSALAYSPWYFAVKGLSLLGAPPGEVLAQAFYQGAMVSVLALYLYSKAVALLGPPLGSSFAALVPVFAVAQAWLFLGEKPSGLAVLGLVVVTAGMLAGLAAATPR